LFISAWQARSFLVKSQVVSLFVTKKTKLHDLESKTPIGQVMIDRRTGMPVGPVAPINPADWPYSDIAHSEILWRYLDFWKFEDLLRKSALYFARCDRFKDPFEGRFSPANSVKISASQKALLDAYPISWSHQEAEARQEITRHCVFISCWHRAKQENREMWDAYTSGPESVLITTSAKALYRFIPDAIVKSVVKYESLDLPRTEFSHSSLFLYKPPDYRFENEFRLLRFLGEKEAVSYDDPADHGRHVPIRLNKIIHRVITHSKATEQFKAKVENLMRQHLKHIRRENSFLLP
jgi:hypothetical protein